jgi:hypothetical protein
MVHRVLYAVVKQGSDVCMHSLSPTVHIAYIVYWHVVQSVALYVLIGA